MRPFAAPARALMQVLAQEIVGPPLQSLPQVQVQQDSPGQHVVLEQSSQAGVHEEELSG